MLICFSFENLFKYLKFHFLTSGVYLMNIFFIKELKIKIRINTLYGFCFKKSSNIENLDYLDLRKFY